jgi:PleD family two-component response regulator
MSWDEIGHLFRDINALRVRFKRKENAFIDAIIHNRKFHNEDMDSATSQVLVIDDDEIIQMHAKALLEKNNIQVSLADNGRQGLDALFDSNNDFDLVLLDLSMPEMTGYEVLQKIREQPEYREIPIIVISSTSDKASVVKALKNGAVDFVIKPFDNNELMARVNIQLSASLRDKQLDNIIDERIANLKSL